MIDDLSDELNGFRSRRKYTPAVLTVIRGGERLTQRRRRVWFCIATGLPGSCVCSKTLHASVILRSVAGLYNLTHIHNTLECSRTVQPYTQS